jgi:hypothetical protein
MPPRARSSSSTSWCGFASGGPASRAAVLNKCGISFSSAAQGRATSTSDGFAIAFAASELLLSTGALTLCATHMERMADLGALYAGSKHGHLRIVALNDRIQFVHELTEARFGLLPGKCSGRALS